MSEELKLCPFCGGEGQISPDGEVYCKDCGCYPEPFNNDPIENWNTRHEPIGISDELPEWFVYKLNETIINCELLEAELKDDNDIEEAVRVSRRANTLRWVLSLRKPESP